MPQPRLHISHAARQAAYRRRQEAARQGEAARQSEHMAKGLPPLPAIATLPGNARWRQATSHAARLLADILAEMEEYCDERSEAWQESERGEAHQERMDALRQMVEALDEVWS